MDIAVWTVLWKKKKKKKNSRKIIYIYSFLRERRWVDSMISTMSGETGQLFEM